MITPLRSPGDPPGISALKPRPRAGLFIALCSIRSRSWWGVSKRDAPLVRQARIVLWARALLLLGPGGRLAPIEQFSGEREVALRALGFDVVEERGPAVAGCLGQPD